MQLLDFRAMNTSVLMALEGQGSSDEGLRETQAFIQECERRFSRFLLESEVSRLNRLSGQWCEVSDELLDLLVLSKAYYQETGGLFDPSVLPDLKRAGYDVSMDDVRKRGNLTRELEPRAPRAVFGAAELDTAGVRVRLPEGMEIDLGGIAKGWIVQEAALRLKAYGTAAGVSAGGDMFFVGLPADGNRWQVEIEDPRDENKTVAALRVGEGAVVTSSISKRTWSQNGQLRHHIIDPRTGEPAQPEWISVTVIAPRADLAEAYAKAFLIGGPKDATRLMLQRPRLAVLSVGADGQVSASQNIKDYLNGSNQYVQQE
jgi:FAD:protein FMN transferase